MEHLSEADSHTDSLKGPTTQQPGLKLNTLGSSLSCCRLVFCTHPLKTLKRSSGLMFLLSLWSSVCHVTCDSDGTSLELLLQPNRKQLMMKSSLDFNESLLGMLTCVVLTLFTYLHIWSAVETTSPHRSLPMMSSLKFFILSNFGLIC